MNEWIAQPRKVTLVEPFDQMTPVWTPFPYLQNVGAGLDLDYPFQLWNVMITCYSLRRFSHCEIFATLSLFTFDIGNVVEQHSVQLRSWKREMVLKLKWAELTWSGLFCIEREVVMVSVCIHFILIIVEPSFVFIFNLSNSKRSLWG